ncbi:MAG: hypothetical protein Q7S89_03100 [bacterium]|nr:hypothetical protein [bacterium]
MENLAGRKDCDVAIERELVRCGIEIVRDQPRDGEVPSSIRGKLGRHKFSRAWYYWVARGLVPIHVARELYADPVGKTDIRVNGNCGCPAPGEPGGEATWLTADARIVASAAEEAKFHGYIAKGIFKESVLDEYVFSDDPRSLGAQEYIDGYHIDTEVGLRLFADTLKKHYLV